MEEDFEWAAKGKIYSSLFFPFKMIKMKLTRALVGQTDSQGKSGQPMAEKPNYLFPFMFSTRIHGEVLAKKEYKKPSQNEVSSWISLTEKVLDK